MSTLAERARMEAEETEAAEEEETPTEPTEPTEPEPEPAPEPQPQGLTEKDAERLSKQADRAAATYIDKVMPIAQTLGWQVEPCPLCELPGLAQVRSAEQVTSDVESAVLRLIGKSQPPEFQAGREYERCADCDGWGDVLTGAQKEISRTAMCTSCGGKGYKQVVPAFVPQNGATAPPYPGATVPFAPVPGGIPDQWGRPAGHVHWGIDPANVGA